MAATCETRLPNGEPCGIQAWGRCSVGQEAFCITHAAYGSLDGPLTNLCGKCQTAAEQRQQADAQLASQVATAQAEGRAQVRKDERADFDRYFASLRRSNVKPPDRRVVMVSKPKKFALNYKNGYKTVPEDLGPVWLVGEMRWRVTHPAISGTMERDARIEYRRLPTCVLPSGDVAPVDDRDSSRGTRYVLESSWADLHNAFERRANRSA